jgi:hypothetical protein
MNTVFDKQWFANPKTQRRLLWLLNHSRYFRTLSDKIHKEFHKQYGYRNNTSEQMVEFADTYDGFVIGQNC